MHAADDDSPYWVDGIKYCGRCHRYIPIHLDRCKEAHVQRIEMGGEA